MLLACTCMSHLWSHGKGTPCFLLVCANTPKLCSSSWRSRRINLSDSGRLESIQMGIIGQELILRLINLSSTRQSMLKLYSTMNCMRANTFWLSMDSWTTKKIKNNPSTSILSRPRYPGNSSASCCLSSATRFHPSAAINSSGARTQSFRWSGVEMRLMSLPSVRSTSNGTSWTASTEAMLVRDKGVRYSYAIDREHSSPVKVDLLGGQFCSIDQSTQAMELGHSWESDYLSLDGLLQLPASEIGRQREGR